MLSRCLAQVGQALAAMAVIGLPLAAGQTRGQSPARDEVVLTHKDPAGFEVSLPAGWKAIGDAGSGRIELRAEAGDTLIVWPVFAPGAGDLSLQFNLQVFVHLARQACPPGDWSPPRQIAPAALQMSGRRDSAELVAAYAWIATPRGTAGYLYCVTAPQGLTAAKLATYSRVLSSLRFSGVGSAARHAAPALRYVRWIDPVEQAFSLEVPADWAVRGGTRRMTALEVRHGVEIVAPGKEVIVRVGDLEVPMFEEPAPPAMGVYFPELVETVPAGVALPGAALPSRSALCRLAGAGADDGVVPGLQGDRSAGPA